jgi:hypothetical protein
MAKALVADYRTFAAETARCKHIEGKRFLWDADGFIGRGLPNPNS